MPISWTIVWDVPNSPTFREPTVLPWSGYWQKNCCHFIGDIHNSCIWEYSDADKSLARPEWNKLMFLSEWREFPSAPCLAGKKTWWQLASRCCWNLARPWHASELVSFLVGLKTYQHPGICKSIGPEIPWIVNIRPAIERVPQINFIMKILFVTILYFNLSESRDCKVFFYLLHSMPHYTVILHALHNLRFN